MVERYGLPPQVNRFAEYWRRYLKAYPWDEYGFCVGNLVRGLRPPVSGWFQNSYIDNMGSPIRSEIWACLAPAEPQLAAEWAWRDAVLDHAGGEGVWGEMFWAGVQSAAFVVRDVPTLLEIGLNMIPGHCRIARSIREVVWCHANGKSWGEARERIVRYFGHHHPCHAVANHGFTVIGWLYGHDYGDRLCKAVNCGYDTDCTGATLGATLGILGGISGIPAHWSEPIGRRIVLNGLTKAGGFDAAPASIDELAERACRLTEGRCARGNAVVTLADAEQLPPDIRSRLFDNARALRAAAQDVCCATEEVDGREVRLHYRGEPVLRSGLAKTMHASLDGVPLGPDRLAIAAPAGVQVQWRVDDGSDPAFAVLAERVEGDVRLALTVRSDGGRKLSADFLLLAPDSAPGFPAMQNVPKCPRCGCRVAACICSPADRNRGLTDPKAV